MLKVKINYRILKWLSQHAREIDDLFIDDKGWFVFMKGRSKIKGLRTDKRIYLPKLRSYNEYE